MVNTYRENFNQNDYYTAEEVAKINGVTKDAILRRCRQGKFSGAFKASPTPENPQGIWRIPKSAIDSPVIIKDVAVINKQFTPQELRSVFKETIHSEVELLREALKRQINIIECQNEKLQCLYQLEKEVHHLRVELESHNRRIDERLREVIENKEETKGFWPRLFRKFKT